MEYRLLTEQEIIQLTRQGCQADNWQDVLVKDGFQTAFVRNTIFMGSIKLGRSGDPVEVERGLFRPAGLCNCTLQHCEIGDGVFISNTELISNYCIDDHVVIYNTGSIMVSGETTFGNGTELEIMSEAGGREIIIFDRLSAQLAYIFTFYRHDQELIKQLRFLILSYVAGLKSATGRIGSHSRICHAGKILNVTMGSYAEVSGARLLEECSITSHQAAPVKVGEGAIVKKAVLLSGSSVTGGAFVEKCLIGQGVMIGRQFSAENSVFFANTEAVHGEACSIFAGPYTVSHHKSTLLVAGMFSFYNAGSGTNISNHMYKLGPLHQGIVERGSKTGSSSYMLWPCRIGAYSVLVGKHLTNFDTSDFPFSYITEEKGKSTLYPAMNLFTVGTKRDSEKWPARDKRSDPEKFDLITFDLFNPYLANKMANAVVLLGEMADKTPKTQEFVNFKGVQISRLLLRTTRKFYETALKAYIGGVVAGRIMDFTSEFSLDTVRKMLAPSDGPGTGQWRDLSGMLAPGEAIEQLLDDIKAGMVKTPEHLQKRFGDLHQRYGDYAWNWCAAYILKETGMPANQITKEALIQIITDWMANAIKLNNMILQDASKEFDRTSHYGFGIDGDDTINDADFEAVRGNYDNNKFVNTLKKETESIEERGARLISVLKTL